MEEYSNYTYVYSNERREVGSGYNYGVVEGLRSFEDALCSLIKYEMGYGGQVREVTPTKIVVQTRVLSKIDIVTVESSEEEMVPLLVALHLWVEAAGRVTVEAWHERLVQMFGNPDGTIRPCFAAWGAAFAKTDLVHQILNSQ